MAMIQLNIQSSHDASDYSLVNENGHYISDTDFVKDYTSKREEHSSNIIPLMLVKNDSLFSKAWFWMVVQGTCSITLTLANKYLSMNFSSPLLVIMIQNVVSLLFFVIFNHVGVFPFKYPMWRDFAYQLPSSMFFVLLTWTSLEGLRLTSVSLFTIIRNLVPMITAILDMTVFGYSIDFQVVSSLISIFLGGVFYSIYDFSLDWQGFHWIILNTCCSVAIPMIEKRLLYNYLQGQTPAGMNFTRNLLSIPLLMIILMVKDDMLSITNSFQLLNSPFIWFSLLMTSAFGFFIGLSYFFLLRLTSNTSISIANTTYKLLTLLISFAFFGVSFSLFGWIGIILSFQGVFFFSIHSRKSPPKNKSK
ncbi:predicted protein [Naegleria gruberi]|uniref:Predicted protein n=1 Tax=Naegleria gruberi TaxID=5762 RepID=D2VFJ5_NAEGR|nr:uncharacterized protein NAEGRDRAFT_67648 [Naegleria gruberi]EFC44478.1 predicted protein [Naegleria gruberi]|eukprot:XP_002677222.1 predicted protein [Naegleria gruberi strain NEG-M]